MFNLLRKFDYFRKHSKKIEKNDLNMWAIKNNTFITFLYIFSTYTYGNGIKLTEMQKVPKKIAPKN